MAMNYFTVEIESLSGNQNVLEFNSNKLFDYSHTAAAVSSYSICLSFCCRSKFIIVRINIFRVIKLCGYLLCSEIKDLKKLKEIMNKLHFSKECLNDEQDRRTYGNKRVCTFHGNVTQHSPFHHS